MSLKNGGVNGHGLKRSRIPGSFTDLAEAADDPGYCPKRLRHESAPQAGMDEVKAEGDYSRLLVLYSGGTIGMKVDQGAYSPAPGFLCQEIRRLPMFHDDEFAQQLVEDKDEEPPLIMPLSKDGKRVMYRVCEYEPLLDSSNMTMTDWARIAYDIQVNYDKYDGFVILHGTDTMAYTASALSFMLENLGKPVILTGSQIPIFETRSDGRDNFLGALIMAGHYCIPEVTIYFNNKLMRGNRCMKMDAGSFDAFHSPNLEPLAELEIDITVRWDTVFRPMGPKKFKIATNLCSHVGLLRLFPSITTDTVRAFVQPPLEGLVIQSYGAGNGPACRKDLLQVFEEATKRGVIIVNITQCSRGFVSPLYAAGKAFSDVGIIAGSDMTPEAALTKLAYVLGNDLSLEQKRKMVSTNLHGEMKMVVCKVNENEPVQPLLELPLLEKMKEMMRLSSEEEMKMLKDAVFPSLLCAAAKNGDLDALKSLKGSGALLSALDYDGRGALHVAASEGHLEMVRYLIDYGCSVHERDRWGNSPLDDAIRFNQHEVIKLLICTGAHLTLPSHKLGTAMCTASVHDDLPSIKSYVLAGGSVNQGDYDDRTCLQVASAHGYEDIVKYLLSVGGDPEMKDSFGYSALDEARRHNYLNLAKLMEDHIKNRNAG